MNQSILLVLTNPVPGREAEFNDWYDNRHVPEVLAVPGFVSCTRFVRSTEAWPTGREGVPQGYYACYGIEGSIRAAMDELARQTATGQIVLPDCVDTASISITPFEPIG
jgi:hypothetical protein